ncbi:MAG: coenzyme F420-0:L-glutamate ligase [Methanobacterium sp.]|uniref:coenzyme F420-0:L-glutamate ligase n=1 Tax=Methanobacterium sp. TaxID=2164 RepID=UPI003D65EACE|nr:coenzyme F420-0:L-glutamate ligase [Methanobacterium sp.]
MEIRIIGIENIPIITGGDDIADLTLTAMAESKIKVEKEDVFVIAETIISKAEGNKINLNDIETSSKSIELAQKTGKDPKLVEAIIKNSNEILKVGPDFIISETKHGFVCANAGIDESNVDNGMATPIPDDPDQSAHFIREKIEKTTNKEVVVIISDTQGRAFREGAIGTAIGISGMNPLWDRKCEKDLYGRELQTTSIAVADELASAASIVMGQADEGIPVVLIKGVNYIKDLKNKNATINDLIRPKEYDVFR